MPRKEARRRAEERGADRSVLLGVRRQELHDEADVTALVSQPQHVRVQHGAARGARLDLAAHCVGALQQLVFLHTATGVRRTAVWPHNNSVDTWLRVI